MYWTNAANGSTYGAIHKAFTEPFVRDLPIYSYSMYDLEESYAVAATNWYLFFTGLVN